MKEINIKDLLQCIHQRDFKGMLEYIPEGIEHRGSIYKEPEDFELMGSYEEDARYGYPARLKMMDACLEMCIKKIEEKEFLDEKLESFMKKLQEPEIAAVYKRLADK